MGMEELKEKDIQELDKLFMELSNHHLVPELEDYIAIAIEKFESLREDDEELYEMIIVADLEEKAFIFATGDGCDLESKDDESVFLIAKSEEFDDCMELLTLIADGGAHKDAHLKTSSVVYHWIGDAMPDIDEDLSITIYGNYYYGETEADPLYES